jgi:hypothetical protein
MGSPYYPAWLDSLADDVSLEASAMDGAAHGADHVLTILASARQLYDDQKFNYAGPCGQHRFLEDYSSSVRGVPTHVIVLVTLNPAGLAERVIVNHRPRSAMLQFSRLMLEKFAGTPYAKYWQGTP